VTSDVSALKPDVIVLKTDVRSLKTDVGVLKADVNTLKTQSKQLACPVGYTYLPGLEACYKLNTQRLSWDHAQDSCAASGASLVSITSALQTHYIIEYIKSTGATYSGTCGGLTWIGGQRQNPNSCSTPFVWKTSRGEQTPFTYTNWFTWEPNCAKGEEKCVRIMDLARNMAWDDGNCHHSQCSLCQK